VSEHELRELLHTCLEAFKDIAANCQKAENAVRSTGMEHAELVLPPVAASKCCAIETRGDIEEALATDSKDE